MKRKFVYKLSSHGFLLLEHLIAILITSILMIILLSFIQLTKVYSSNTDLVSQNQIDALATQLQIESKIATRFATVNPSELDIYLQDGFIVTYRIQNQKLMRQVEGKGGEVALYHCQALTVEPLNESAVYLHLQTTNKNYRLYLTILSLPLPMILAVEEEEAVIEEIDLEAFPEEEVTDTSDEDISSENESSLESETEESMDSTPVDEELLDPAPSEFDPILNDDLEEAELDVNE